MKNVIFILNFSGLREAVVELVGMDVLDHLYACEGTKVWKKDIETHIAP